VDLWPGARSQGHEADLSHLLPVPRLRMGGVIPPISHTPSRHAHGQLYSYAIFTAINLNKIKVPCTDGVYCTLDFV
jgi:hypothetical protein